MAAGNPEAQIAPTVVIDAIGRGVHLEGPLTPAAVLTLGGLVAGMLDPTTFSPDGVVVDHEGKVALLPAKRTAHFRAPEGPAPTPGAAVWSLGRMLLELSLGADVPDDVMANLSQPVLAGTVDRDGRPLAPRLVEVLWAMVVPDPENRLQSPRAVARACEEGAKTFGDGQVALRDAAIQRMRGTTRSTADLPARAILTASDLSRLVQPTIPHHHQPQLGGGTGDGAAPMGALSGRDVAGRVVDTSTVRTETDVAAPTDTSPTLLDSTTGSLKAASLAAAADADARASSDADDDDDDDVPKQPHRPMMMAAFGVAVAAIVVVVVMVLR